jgi:5'-nucleotidase
MRILLTNDDGIHAHGLKVLEEIAREISDEIVIVAPEMDQSGVAHSLSLSNPLRLREISPRHFAVQGTPTDCVLMGVRRIMADAPPDLVLSGVNRGQNIAEDVTYSGTVAAAMEGALLGIPSIALSQAYGGAEGRHAPRWDTAKVHGGKLVKAILAAGIPPGGLVNVNFPPCPAAEVAGVGLVRQGRRSAELLRIEERHDGRGLPYYWLMFQRQTFTPPAGTDIAALIANRISLTPLRLDLTDDETLRNYENKFAELFPR